MKSLAFLSCTSLLTASTSLAATPAQLGAFGFSLYSTPSSASSLLEQDYKRCDVLRTPYHKSPGDTGPIIAELSVNLGLADNDPGASVCSYSPAGNGLTDAIEAKFVHPQIDADQPMYWLRVERLYPDAISGHPARVRNTFDGLRAQLFKMYGRPIDERRETMTSDLSPEPGKKNVKRTDYRVRYLWAAKGRLADQALEDSGCRCDGPYVKAVITMARSPSTIPQNSLYVLSLTLSVEDQDLRARQDTWNAQWLKATK